MIRERGLTLTCETIRYWCLKFGLTYARKLKASKQWGDTWHLDEVNCRIVGEMIYLWRAIDQDGQTINLLVQRKRNQLAAARFFRKLRKHNESPRTIVTDKLKATLYHVKHCLLTYYLGEIRVLTIGLRIRINRHV